ncbi:hypothetical protein LEM8419_03220 [Neolewinella maritima]|uniref:Lipocalin-like domain-containing protein n=1 Tax=Neolewinella maritima TaxID=1383882 RepID=A0ABN8F5V8_9BACT|nr:hypothetical protein [Neolewinella maritima]CAH1002304.1 hypothetical protein LEM8419_03220 [Neolewinella maritima]
MSLLPTLFRSALLCLLLSSCLGEEVPATTTVAAPSSDLTNDLLGTWETVELDIQYASFQGGDTAYAELIQEADWGRKYGVRPPSTVFTPDGKLRRTHRLRSGQVANVTHGIWRTQGDSLLVIEPNVTYTYYPDLRGDRLQLTGITDQDKDGERDDTYRAVYRLVSRTR